MFIRKKTLKGYIYYSLETRFWDNKKVKSKCIAGLGRNPYTGLKVALDNKTIDIESYNRMIEKLKQDGIKDTLKVGYFIPLEDLNSTFSEEFSNWLKENFKQIELDLYE